MLSLCVSRDTDVNRSHMRVCVDSDSIVSIDKMFVFMSTNHTLTLWRSGSMKQVIGKLNEMESNYWCID